MFHVPAHKQIEPAKQAGQVQLKALIDFECDGLAFISQMQNGKGCLQSQFVPFKVFGGLSAAELVAIFAELGFKQAPPLSAADLRDDIPF